MHGLGPGGLRARRTRSGPDIRHRMFLRTARRSRRLPQPQRRRERSRPCRRRSGDDGAPQEHLGILSGHALTDRALPCLRRGGRRVRPLRGLRRGGPQATARRTARRRSDPGRGARHGHQLRRPDTQHRDAVVGRTGCGLPGRARRRRRRPGHHRCHRGTRHRNPGWGPDRIRQPRNDIRQERHGPSRLGEVKLRPYRSGRGRAGFRQSRPRGSAREGAAHGALQPATRGTGPDRDRLESSAGDHAVAHRRRRAAPGRGLLLRCLGHQRARHRRTGTDR